MIGASKRMDRDMTEGKIWKVIIGFAFPLLIGNIFQQMYNTVDSIVVGNFVGKEALAAVGSVGPIINTLIGIFMGFASGAGVVMSQYYGAKDEKHMHDTVHTTVFFTLILSVAFTIAGIIFTPALLRLMSTPADVMEQAGIYLKIYFAGVSGLMIYNIGSGILRAVGDSRRPLYFLIFSACVNTVLDIIFVVVFKWGVAGVAYATIIAQFLSAILVVYVLVNTSGYYRLIIKDIKPDLQMFKSIVRIGFPSALQMAVTSFSNVIVQGYINGFGSACMAGWSSYSKIDQFALLPMQSISLASTTFVGQNLGAQKLKRAKKGTMTAMIISIGITAILIIPLMIFAREMVMMFNSEEDVLYYGALFIRIISPFTLLACINQILNGALRGAGDTKAPMLIMLGSFVVFRQIYLFAVSKLYNSIIAVTLGYPAGWLLCSVICILYYRFSHWEKRRLIISEIEE